MTEREAAAIPAVTSSTPPAGKIRPAPDPRVHQQHSFICGAGGCAIGVSERSERDIAGMVLEDCGDWLTALGRLERRQVPDGVRAALGVAHEALAGWVDFLDRQAGRESRRAGGGRE